MDKGFDRPRVNRVGTSSPDLLCLSHLRWNFVFQRPQHLLTRLAQHHRVLFFEEPIWEDLPQPRLEVRHETCEGGGVVLVGVPHLPGELRDEPMQAEAVQRDLLDDFVARHAQPSNLLLWYYTPMAMGMSAHLPARAVIYDCMDELSNFAGAPPELRIREQALLRRADLVMTGGRSLYEAKREKHPSVHCFPSSVDVKHFRRARTEPSDPEDQAWLPGPRLGYAGVIDERMDLELLSKVAALRQDWQLVMLGPVVKVDPALLPRAPNVHYLGMKAYADLPRYMRGWDLGMLPFALNDATKFISPTKTPEYLAAGLPVVSTPIRDVVHPYGTRGLVRIAESPEAFVAHAEEALAAQRQSHWEAADAFLQSMSWDETVRQMRELIEGVLARSETQQSASA